MAATTKSSGRLRRLADFRPEHGRVLSVYIDLDPSIYPTARERASQITSVLDEAAKRIEEQRDELTHDELVALRSEPERVREQLDPQTLGAGGALGLAIFACAPANLLEVIRLPHPVETRFEIARTPFVEPLARDGELEVWVVALVNSRDARIFVGDEGGLEEVARVQDDVHSWHDQGGWSQRRYQQGIQEERKDHLDHVVDALMELLRSRPFDRLIVGGPEPIDSTFAERLHPYLRERLSGHIHPDVENSSAADVLAAAAPVFDEHRRAHEREAIERLRAGFGREGGRAAAGREAVVDALEQRRVEVLMLEPGVDAEDLVEQAIDQSAEVLVLRDSPDLGPHGGIAALLRW
jgi:peptide chain release factor subunit 1